MNQFFISGVVSAFICTVLGIFVYLKNRRNPINWTFTLFVLATAIYAFGFSQQSIALNKASALFWIRIILMGTIFIPIFFLQLIHAVLEKKIAKHKLLVLYIFGFIFEIINFTTEWFAKDPLPKYTFRFLFQAGFLYPILFLFFAILVIHAFYELWVTSGESRTLMLM